MTFPHTPGFKGAINTGREAAAALSPRLGGRQQEALDALAAHGPATADEIAERIGRHWYCVRPRFSELRELGQIVDTGRRKPTPFGGKTWEARVATPEELALYVARKAAEAEKEGADD